MKDGRERGEVRVLRVKETYSLNSSTQGQREEDKETNREREAEKERDMVEDEDVRTKAL